jgi:hypothetical protein
VFGAGILRGTARRPNEFVIHLQDCNGQDLSPAVGGESFSVRLEYKGQLVPFTASIDDRKNSRYFVQYTASVFGVYDLFVEMITDSGSIPASGSPFTIQFSDGGKCAPSFHPLPLF